jgi:putative ABC transport system substrate-binding protein
VRRREFITLLGGAAAAWPLAARAQQPKMREIGWLSPASAADSADRLAAFLDGLKEAGFVEGRTVAIEYRWADDHTERLPALAAELVSRNVAVLGTGSGTSAALAAKAATSTIPIVFVIAADPVRAGLVTSLNRPTGNITGIVGFTDLLITKRLELLTELMPGVRVVGALLNAANPNSEVRSQDLQAAGGLLGRDMRLLWARSPDELEKVIADAIQQKIEAIVVQNDTLFIGRRIVDLTARYRLPVIFETREEVLAGALASYGPSNTLRYRLAGDYVGRILKGAKPADLPVMQPTKFELVINLKTAKALGLDVPPMLLARADEVIE